jgi:hypothetical protein
MPTQTSDTQPDGDSRMLDEGLEDHESCMLDEGHEGGDSCVLEEGDEDEGVTYFAPTTWLCGGTLRITDPGYTKADGAAGAALTRPAAAGRWYACARNVGGYVSHLITWAVEEPMSGSNVLDWGYTPFSTCVDNGQCGVFDDARYPDGPVGEHEDPESFYGRSCAVTDGLRHFGLIDDLGVVCQSGFGDGYYAARERVNSEGLVSAIYIEFFDENGVGGADGGADGAADGGADDAADGGADGGADGAADGVGALVIGG